MEINAKQRLLSALINGLSRHHDQSDLFIRWLIVIFHCFIFLFSCKLMRFFGKCPKREKIPLTCDPSITIGNIKFVELSKFLVWFKVLRTVILKRPDIQELILLCFFLYNESPQCRTVNEICGFGTEIGGKSTIVSIHNYQSIVIWIFGIR